MAFGGGALIEALSIELFGHIMHQQEEFGPGVTFTAIGGGIIGGVLFSGVNRLMHAINSGFSLRKQATAKVALTKLRRRLHRAVIKRLSILKLLHHLSEEDLDDLAVSLKREAVAPGSLVCDDNSHEDDGSASVYFVLSGAVRVTLYDFVTPESAPTLPAAAVSTAASSCGVPTCSDGVSSVGGVSSVSSAQQHCVPRASSNAQ